MANVFISYSRKDKEAAHTLAEACKAQELDVWIDWEGIEPTTDWWKEIEKGIEQADNFLFLISPDSALSPICKREIEHAVKNGKRLIPVVVRDIKSDESPSELRSLHWLFLRETDDFPSVFEKLVIAVKTDYIWVQFHRRLQVKALEWERSDRENSLLLRGKDLQDAESQLVSNSSKEPHPTDLQREYVLRSRQASDRQRRWTVSILLAVALIMAVLAIFAIVQAKLATEQEKISRAGDLAAQSAALRANNFRVSLLLGIEAFDTLDTLRTRGNLLEAAKTSPQLMQFLTARSVLTVASSPDGKMLASGSEDGTIILWDTSTYQQIGEPIQQPGSVRSIAFSPDGRKLAVSLYYLFTGENARIRILAVDTHHQIGEMLPQTDVVWSVAFSPNGTRLASGIRNPSTGNGEIIFWDVETFKQVGSPLQLDVDMGSFVFSLDGTILASGSVDKIILWNADTHQQIGEPLQLTGSVSSLAYSPDGKMLASGSEDGTIILWDTSTYQRIGEPIQSARYVSSITFSRDGRTLAWVDNDFDDIKTNNSIINLWDVDTHQQIGDPLQISGYLSNVIFLRDGRTLASSSDIDNGTIILWVLDKQHQVGEPLPDVINLADFAYSPDGTKLASVSYDGTMALWDLSTYQQIGEPLQLTGNLQGFTFSPDGTKLASVSYDPFTGEDLAIILWDVETRQQIGVPFQYPAGDISSIVISPNGRTLGLSFNALSTGTDGTSKYTGTIIFWDIETHQQIGEPLQVGRRVSTFAFSPDGRTLVSTSGGRIQSDTSTIIFWDVDTHRQIGESIQHAGAVTSVAFSPDGVIMASGTWGGTTILWDVETHQQLGEPLRGHSISVLSVAFSPDGTKLASSGNEGNLILWDVDKHQQIGGPIPGHVYAVDKVAFSPDGTKLASKSGDTIILWDLLSDSWLKKSCQRAGRNFTRGEWEQYFPNDKYRKTCEQWPLEQEATPIPSPTP